MRKLIVALCLFVTPALATETIGNDTVCFVPGPDDCAMLAVAEISKATRTVDVQAYGFTEPHIARALSEAHDRGVSVRLIADKSAPHEHNSMIALVAGAAIPVWIDYRPRIAHNKVMVIDGATVLTGSQNWTVAADTRNAENLLIIHDPALAAAYEANFESRLQASETLDEYEAAHTR